MKKVLILDTTLRDGEQAPGAKLNLYQKLEIASQLKKLKVDIIEAGFSASSPGDFEAVKAIAKKVGDGPMITALARAVKEDILSVYESVKYAERPIIHMVLGTSDVHVDKKFNKTKEEILQTGIEAVKYAKTLLPQVQYSTEDASRSDFEYLWKTIEAVIKAGATIINVPDTVGYAVPEEFGELINKLNYRIKNLNPNVILSVHCHNDTGLATANTLAAIKNGADKIECTINGIGERAGNTALEEIVMGLKLRKEYYKADTDIITTEIKKTSNLVSSLMGIDVQVNKAITGDNAFAHSSGIHQDALLKDRSAYEVINPEDVGVDNMEIVLTARSGKHAFKDSILKLGLNIDENIDFESLFKSFLELADIKKEIYNQDLIYLIEKYHTNNKIALNDKFITVAKNLYDLHSLQVITNDIFPTATVKVKKGEEILSESATGDGPIDALYTAIKNITGVEVELKEYKIKSMSRGKEALGRVTISMEYKGKSYFSNATHTDIIKASALALINGINSIILEEIIE